MPEGPEIRRVADRIKQQIGGRVIDDAWFAFPELAEQAFSVLKTCAINVYTVILIGNLHRLKP